MKILKDKYIKVCAFILGMILVITGIVFVIKSQDTHTGYNGGLTRASTSIKFGADFYTDSAQYTALAANAVCDLYTMITMGIGIFFVFVGGTDICIIGLKLKKSKK